MVLSRVAYVVASFAMVLGCSLSDDGVDTAEVPTVHPDQWPQIASPIPLDPTIEEAVTALMARMTVEEKVGQVIQGEIGNVTPADVREYHLGSVLNGGGSHPGGDKQASPADWIALADSYWEASMDTSDGGQAIPIIWGSDAVHGHNNVIGATIFPHNIGLGATRNPDLIKRIGEATAREVAATGLDWTFGPTVAVARDDRWGRTYESYSEDPEIVRDYARAVVEGYQGVAGTDELFGEGRVIATAKHFLADGGTEGGRDQGDSLASEQDLRDIHGAGYPSALSAGVQTVMASFSSWHGVKMHANEELLTDVLKGRMGFDGFVVGDWNGHGQIPGCSNESCAQAINAGVDMIMVPEDWKALYQNTLEQVGSGEIPPARLDDAVRRILRVKMRAGLFETDRPSTRPLAGKTEIIGAAAHRAVAREAVRESLVLLKNEGGVLPLRGDQRVLVAGDGADNIGKQTGGWTITWQGTGNENDDFPGASSLWDGIRHAVEDTGGTAVLSADGSYSQKPDAAIVVYGEDPYAEFQGDRASVAYQPGNQRDLRLLRRLKEAGIPVVSVFLSGRPLWVNAELNASDAFVAAWLPGSEGQGIADVLFRDAGGDVAHDFKGRLSFSWPRKASQARLNRGDADYAPLFPYGFGLTYADDGSLAALSEESDVEAAQGAHVYYASGPVAPWTLYVEDENGRVAVDSGGATTSKSENLVVRAIDREAQEDARTLIWSGQAVARALIRAEEPIDLRRESNGEMALGLDLRVDQAASAPVTLAMGCGEGCSGRLDVGAPLAGLPVGEWTSLRFRLRCFAAVGADMSKIDTPLFLETAGTLGISVSAVKLVSAAEGNADCP